MGKLEGFLREGSIPSLATNLKQTIMTYSLDAAILSGISFVVICVWQVVVQYHFRKKDK
jgi:hypothetical protein